MRSRPVPAIELLPEFKPRPKATHVIFDFDGTLSLVRAGWASVMLDLFLELTPPRNEPVERWRAALIEDIHRHNGKPTIHQMESYVTLVAERGGPVGDPRALLAEFKRRLDRVIEKRLSAPHPERLTVAGAAAFLTLLRDRGLELHLASGTEERAVRAEAAALGISGFFGERIYGPRGESDGFSKRAVVERLLAVCGGDASRLVAFGDGVTEISETSRVGALACAVATDESEARSGVVDQEKRRVLLAAGAHAVIADYTGGEAIAEALLGKRP